MGNKYNIHYTDGVYYGSMTFNNMSQARIEEEIQEEIEDNNTNPNPAYHITRDSFKEEQ